MAAERPYFQMTTQQLAYMADAPDDRVLAAVLHELSFRNGKAARRLLEQLKGTQGATASKSRNSANNKTQSTNGKLDASSVPKFKPTLEQDVAIEKFRTGKVIKIAAFAGTGKTSTLLLLADTKHQRGLYLAFNKSIAQEAREKFPNHVDCRTTHSIAVRYVRGLGQYSRGKLFDSINANQLAGNCSPLCGGLTRCGGIDLVVSG